MSNGEQGRHELTLRRTVFRRVNCHSSCSRFFRDNPQPFFQWIPGRRPQTNGDLFRGRVDLSYEVDDAGKYHKHSAIKIIRPTTKFSGAYKCKVSSLFDEDFRVKEMIVYSKLPSKFCSTACA